MKSLSILTPSANIRQASHGVPPATIRTMSTPPPSLAAAYAQLGEPELYALARDYDSLTDEAQSALRAEFATRGLEPPLLDEAATNSRNLVTLRRYRDLSEAIVARSLLESAGIVVYLRDENLVRLDWQISNFIGGIRLQVDEVDAAGATELLNQPVPEEIQFAGPFDHSGPEFEQPHCPRCGSIDITFEGKSRGAALASLYVFGLPMPSGRETWLCQTCAARWEDKASQDDHGSRG